MFRNIFRKKDKVEKIKYTGEVVTRLLYANPYIDLVHDSCCICYNTNTDKNTEDKAEYIGKRIKTGHESILEHSNVIVMIHCKKALLEELLEVTELCHYLEFKTIIKDDEVTVLLGGSIRGFKHIIRYIKNPTNKVYGSIVDALYDLDSNLFIDLIEDEVMDDYKFINTLYRPLSLPNLKSKIKELDNLTIVSYDNIENILEDCKLYGFSDDDLLRLCTCTVLFKKMPRIITQQLTRHRNGITQASQRYIDYSKSEFISPAECKPERYNKEDKYEIKIGENIGHYTLQELGDVLKDIYPQLLKQGLLKEDARSYLPNNMESSLYVTFTYANLIKFLELRTHTSAQADIRKCADILEPHIIDIIGKQYIYELIEPEYKKLPKRLEEDYTHIDEVLV